MVSEKDMTERENSVCEDYGTHKDKVETVQKGMPDEETLFDIAELFKVFGDSTRIRILFTLFASELCVCDIADSLSMTVSAVSHQLKILKTAKLIASRRDGKQIFYHLADDHVHDIIAKGLEHVCE